MKKFIVPAVVALVAALFVSCASTGSSGKAGSGSVHPREYTLDLAEGKSTEVPVVFNQYGPNYQSDPAINFTNNVKKDKPQAGDLIHVYYKFTTDIDIPVVRISLIDPTVNYWLELAADDAIVIEDIKAGEMVEGFKDIPLTNGVKGEFKVYIAYDNQDFIDQGYAKVDGPALFTFYDVEDVVSTDTVAELEATGVVSGPKTINIDMNKIAAFCNIVTGHPWVNGQQIMSEIENYQADISYMDLLEEAPEAGDTLVITWRGVSDMDIAALKMMPVDHSASVGWWKVMINDESEENVVIARDIKAGEVFEVTKTFVIDTTAESIDCNLRIWYDYDPETNGPGPCTILAARD